MSCAGTLSLTIPLYTTDHNGILLLGFHASFVHTVVANLDNLDTHREYGRPIKLPYLEIRNLWLLYTLPTTEKNNICLKINQINEGQVKLLHFLFAAQLKVNEGKLN